MMVCYALEQRGAWFVLGFAVSCVLGSVYGFLQGAWPFGVVEAVWAIVALRRWMGLAKLRTPPTKAWWCVASSRSDLRVAADK
jgi:hypothetical protein